MTSITSAPNPAQQTHRDRTINAQVIKCKCGVRILLLPDVKAMNKAIENHLETHQAKDKMLTSKDIDAIRNDLISQIFQKITKRKDSS